MNEVCLLTEFPFETLSPGAYRRVEHYRSYFRGIGVATEMVSLTHEIASTFRASYGRAREAEELLAPGRLLVAVGIGGPIATRAAIGSAQAGREVWLDQCDSAMIQLVGSLGSLRPKTVAFALIRLALRLRVPSSVRIVYISERDKRRDWLLNFGRKVTVIGPAVDNSLFDLPSEDEGQTRRLVVPGDFSSPHLTRGLQLLRRAMREDELGGVSVDTYGPYELPIPLPVEFRHHGYVENISDVYGGNSVIFIANVGGGGVPNKLIEAAAASRPVIIHRSLAKRAEVTGRGWVYSDARSLADVLRRSTAGERAPDLRAARSASDPGGPR